MSVGRRRFRMIKEIAEGGFGKVYLAEQISSDGFSRIVAVKLLHAKWSSHDEVVMRTRDEARLLGLIRHQHIVKVEDLTSIDGKCAIVMEYLEGVDLKWMISFLKERGEHFPRAALFEIILAVASALDAAYNGTPLQGGDPLKVIHRDIKPSNIFVTTAAAVKVLDFGTARANFAEREAKTQALAFGSQGYMAPERMLGEEDTPAADVFSLGITLYELLALESFGRIPPRPNKFAAKVQERVQSVPLSGPSDWQDQVRETLRLMLSYEPGDRPSSAQLVEIMELLAQDAGDTGLRKFCRTTVSEAKDRLPELDTGDPLSGSIVDEDASASYPLGGGASGPQGGRGNTAPIAAGGNESVGGTTAPVAQPSSVSSVDSRHSAPMPARPGTNPALQAPIHADVSAPQARGGGGGMGIGLIVALLVVVLVLGGLALVIGAGGAAWFMSGTETITDVDPVDVPPTPDPVPNDDGGQDGTADAGGQDGSPPPAGGGQVLSPDTRTDVKKVPTVLTYGDAAGGKVTIKGGGGFEAQWDGLAAFDMGPMAEGPYSTLIEPSSGGKIRGKSFTIDGTKRSCAFTFDPDAKVWTGACK